MFRNGIPLALFLVFPIVFSSACVSSEPQDKSLRIQIGKKLESASGILEEDDDHFVTMKALSYPSALKFYTEAEVLRILRFTCDARATMPRISHRETHSLQIEWNFTAKAKGLEGTVNGAPRFVATLAELKPGILRISCSERVY